MIYKYSVLTSQKTWFDSFTRLKPIIDLSTCVLTTIKIPPSNCCILNVVWFGKTYLVVLVFLLEVAASKFFEQNVYPKTNNTG
jgi:hypothetical protein